jgi:serine/threonine protein kinase
VGRIIGELCEVLQAAHDEGIIHRDLKPANLFLTHKVDGAPCVKVLDFGISKVATSEADKGMTKSSDVMGSPYYMSPEQMRSTRAVDARSDIWALGAILYELLAGQPPFDGETMTALIVSIMQEAPRDILGRRRDLPRPVFDIVHRCLQKDPTQRFQDVAALATALGPFAPARAQGGLSRVSAALSSGGHRASYPSQPSPTVPGEPASISSMEGVPPTVVPVSPYSHQIPPQAFGSSSGPVTNGPSAGGEPPRFTPGGAHPSAPVAAAAATALGGAITQMGQVTPAANWGGTYASQRPSRTPLVVGLVGIAVAAIGASMFILLRD